MIENATVDKAEFERNGALHVRTAVIDGASHGQQAFEELSRLRIVLRLTGLDEINEKLRCDVAVTVPPNSNRGRHTPNSRATSRQVATIHGN